MPQSTEQIKQEISLLLAKAESTPYEAERELASARAEKLMLRLGITIAELESAGKRREEQIVEKSRVFPGNYAGSMVHFTTLTADGFGNLTVLSGKGIGLARVAYVIGYESDVDNFLQLLDSLALQVMSALKQWQKENRDSRRYLTDMQKFNQHRGFIVGFGRRVGARLAEARTEAVAEASTGAALVLVGKKDRVDEKVNEMYPQLGRTRGFKVDNTGTIAGHVAGGKATLNTQKGLSK